MRRSATLQIRCSDEEKEAWQRLAAAKQTVLSEYIRALLNTMAKQAEGRGNG